MTANKREEILTKAKPILFNTEMVRAILDGRKTTTRRVVKPQPLVLNSLVIPPYKVGDILYVRETWAKMECNECSEDSYDCESAVERDGLTVFCDGEMYVYKATDLLPDGIKWHPSIHMLKEATRIFLRVTGVSVERLQDISDDGVIAEGIEIGAYFDELWNSTIKKSDLAKYGWAANPWVWVIEFERIGYE